MTRFGMWLDEKLIPGWRGMWLRLRSIQLAAAVAAFAAAVVLNQSLALSLLGMLPDNSFLKILAAVGIFFVVFIVPALTRLWQQKPPDAPNPE